MKNWKILRDQKKIVAVVLLNFSQAFESRPHNLFTGKMYPYGFSIGAVTFFSSYLKRRINKMKG